MRSSEHRHSPTDLDTPEESMNKVEPNVKIHHLTLLRVVTQHRRKDKRKWLCRCVCGKEIEVAEIQLAHNRKKSCGCQHRYLFGSYNPSYKHGLTETSGKKQPDEVAIYHGMVGRCLNPRDKGYDNYGGRGIKVAEEWLGVEGMKRFLAYVGPRPSKKHSIDRYPNNDGNYEPGNVRWATQVEQARNTRQNRLLTHEGVTLCAQEWSERLGFTGKNTLRNRLDRGWTVEQALTVPQGAPRGTRYAT